MLKSFFLCSVMGNPHAIYIVMTATRQVIGWMRIVYVVMCLLFNRVCLCV